MPELQPVTRIVWPASESPSVTCSAVEPEQKPVGPADLNIANRDIWVLFLDAKRANVLFLATAAVLPRQ